MTKYWKTIVSLFGIACLLVTMFVTAGFADSHRYDNDGSTYSSRRGDNSDIRYERWKRYHNQDQDDDGDVTPAPAPTPDPVPAPTPAPAPAPAPTPVLDGQALYTQYCSGCHGQAKRGSSVSAIQNAIASNFGGMGSLSTLTLEEITAISQY